MDMRFDVSARVEVWVTADEIREAPGYADVVNSGQPEEVITSQLRAIARRLAEQRIAEVRGMQITADIDEKRDVDPDRIRWNVLATPERKLEFVTAVEVDFSTREVFVTAKARLTDDGWEVLEFTASDSQGREMADVTVLDTVEREVLRRCELKAA